MLTQFEMFITELLIQILKSAGHPQYVGRLKQLSKAMYLKLSDKVEQQNNEKLKNKVLQSNDTMEGYWKYIYQRDFSDIKINTSSPYYRQLYKAAFEKRRAENNKLKLTPKQKLLFEWCETDDIESIKKNKWQVNVDLCVYNYKAEDPISLASAKKNIRILTYFYELVCELFSLEKIENVSNGRTRLHWASACGIFAEITSDAYNHLINQASHSGRTPIYMAAQNGHLEVVKALIKKGANVNQADSKGGTPLYMAARNGYLEVVKELIRAGANTTTVISHSVTPLSVAAIMGHLEIVKILLAEIDAGMRCFAAFSAFCHAAENNQAPIVNYLLTRIDVNQPLSKGKLPLHYAIENKLSKSVSALINEGADLTVIDNKGLTFFDLAASKDRVIFHILLTAVVNRPFLSREFLLKLALSASIDIKDQIAVGMLIDKFDLNKTFFNNGNTPLCQAVITGNLKIVNLILEKKADIKLSNRKGVTPLRIACEMNHFEIVQTLLEAGADLNQSLNGVTLFDITKTINSYQIHSFLKLWETKISISDKALTDQVIAIIKTSIVPSEYPNNLTFWTRKPIKLMEQLNKFKDIAIDKDSIIEKIQKYKKNLFPEIYNFIFKYIFEVPTSYQPVTKAKRQKVSHSPR